MIYLAPGSSTEQLEDTTLPVLITEGEFKTCALSRLAKYGSETVRFVALGLSGGLVLQRRLAPMVKDSTFTG